jgi:excisionase family DNA binding protein
VLAQQTVATIADERPLLSADGAARHMGTSRWTVYRLHHAGLLKAVKVGTRFKFRPADIDDYLNRSSDDDDRAAS